MKIKKILNKIEEAFIAAALFVATVIVTLNVFLRWVNLGTSWSEELVRYLLIALTFVGMSVCARLSEHVTIDLLPQMTKGKLKIAVHFLIYVVALVFSVLFTWYGFKLVIALEQTAQTSPTLGIPMYMVYLVMPIGGALTVIRYVQKIVALFRTPTAVLTETRKGGIV